MSNHPGRSESNTSFFEGRRIFNLTTGAVYDSLLECCAANNMSAESLRRALNKGTRTAGCKWAITERR